MKRTPFGLLVFLSAFACMSLACGGGNGGNGSGNGGNGGNGNGGNGGGAGGNITPASVAWLQEAPSSTFVFTPMAGAYASDQTFSSKPISSMQQDMYVSVSLSNDGKKVAYSAGAEIYTANIDGTAQNLIQADGSNPEWAPDGSRIVFSRVLSSGMTQTWIMNADGSSEHLVMDGQFTSGGNFSGDGQTIVAGANNGIATFDVSGGNFKQLTTSTYTDSYGSWNLDILPAYSKGPHRIHAVRHVLRTLLLLRPVRRRHDDERGWHERAQSDAGRVGPDIRRAHASVEREDTRCVQRRQPGHVQSRHLCADLRERRRVRCSDDHAPDHELTFRRLLLLLVREYGMGRCSVISGPKQRSLRSLMKQLFTLVFILTVLVVGAQGQAALATAPDVRTQKPANPSVYVEEVSSQGGVVASSDTALEAIKTLQDKHVRVVTIKEKADFILQVTRQLGKKSWKKDTKVVLSNRDGEVILAKSTRSVGGAMGDIVDYVRKQSQ
jgi:hypothetical protein